MTKTEFNNYKKVAKKVINLLCDEDLSSIYAIEIIYNIIRGYPYCIDCKGHYTYGGEFYNCIEDLPVDALEQIVKCNNG